MSECYFVKISTAPLQTAKNTRALPIEKGYRTIEREQHLYTIQLVKKKEKTAECTETAYY